MTSGDIWFLLIFIILPTAVLVSGFWAFLFVRRDPRKTIPRRQRRASEAKSTREPIEETSQVTALATATVPANEQADESEPEPVEELPGPDPDELAASAGEFPDEVEPVEPAEDDVSEPAEEAGEPAPAPHHVEDERLVELVDVEDRENLIAEIERQQAAQPAGIESSTDEIPDLTEIQSEPARLSETSEEHDEWRPHDQAEDDEPDELVAGDPSDSGAELDEDDRPVAGVSSTDAIDEELESEEEPVESDEDNDRDGWSAQADQPSGGKARRNRRRRSGVRLIPTDNEDRQGRRGRLMGRRPSRRDKGGM